MNLKKIFDLKPLNQIVLINILVYIIGVITIFFSQDYYHYYIFFLSLKSQVALDFALPFAFLTNGFIHADIYHIVGNFIIFGLYYTHFMKIETERVWKIYLSAVLMCGIFWILYLHMFEYNESILLGASGGIMALISYSCNKWGEDIAVNFSFIKIRFRHLLYMHITLSVLNYMSHQNVGGEIAHLTGILVGWYYSRKPLEDMENKKSEI